MTDDLPFLAPTAPAAAERSFAVHFGGPDQPPRALRDLLKARIEAAPPGSEITWATYYFRDLGLAEALVAAQQRGVRVRVLLDASPRREGANDAVIAALSRGLGDGLRLHKSWIGGARLHTKIYAFSGPEPEVLIGSFNPSGHTPEDPEVIAEIGDQDRGHNLLISFRDPKDASALMERARRLWSGRGLSRFNQAQNQPLQLSLAGLFFFPRLRTDVVEEDLIGLGPGDRVQAAVSHLDHGSLTRRLVQAAQAGARVEVVVHDTERRVPSGVVEDLAAAGVAIQRHCDPDGRPMHAKFILVRKGATQAAWFGSLNFNFNSKVLNHEVVARSAQPALVAALDLRYRVIAREARTRAWACPKREPAFRTVRKAGARLQVAGDGGPPWPY